MNLLMTEKLIPFQSALKTGKKDYLDSKRNEWILKKNSQNKIIEPINNRYEDE
jgi:hypothetical protein